VTTPQRLPVLDYLPGYPEPLPLRKAWRRWWRETCWFLRHTLTPTETQLPSPARSVAAPAIAEAPPADLKERLAAAKDLVDSAEARLVTVRTKATNLLGFVALVTPLVSWWLLSGRARLAEAPLPMEILGYGLMIGAALCLALSLLALLRSQGVVSYPCQTPDLFVDFESGSLKPHNWAAELCGQALAWGSIQRWSDVITDFFRAGQRFLMLSLLMAVLAGAISYLYPQPTRPVVLVQRPTGELVMAGETTPIAAPAERWAAALWNMVWFIVGVSVTIIVARTYYGGRQGPAPGPRRKNIVRLTVAAAAKIRELQSERGGRYLRVEVQQSAGGLVERRLFFEFEADSANDYLGESEGVQILVARQSAHVLDGGVLDWIMTPEGKEGFCFPAPDGER